MSTPFERDADALVYLQDDLREHATDPGEHQQAAAAMLEGALWHLRRATGLPLTADDEKANRELVPVLLAWIGYDPAEDDGQ